MKIALKGRRYLSRCVFSLFFTVAATARSNLTPAKQPAAQPPAPVTAPSSTNFNADLTGDWFGFRQKLSDAGATVGATLIAEGFDNFQGGIQTRNAVGSTTFDLTLTLDLQKLINLTGGQFYVDLQDHAFRNPQSLVGSLVTTDKYNDPPNLQFNELWYQQLLLNGNLRVKIGKVDANNEFYVVDYGLPFLNDGTQISPTIFPMPTTPDAMPSVNLFLTSPAGFFASFGAYYSNQSDQFGDLVDNPAALLPTRYGAFLIGETGWRWNALPHFQFPGNFKLGVWGDTGTFTQLDGSPQTGTGGGYAIFDQTLYEPPGQNTRAVQMFLEYAATQSDINPIDEHAGIGFTWIGPTQSRSADILGISAQYYQISQRTLLPYPFELALETFYQLQLTPWMQLQPDLQYLIHPGGRYNDALVATVRATIQF